MNAQLEQEVRRRAGGKCEYCRIPQSAEIIPYQIDHVIAEQHGGPTVSENLALACPFCNRHKGPNIAGIDPASGSLTRLFHPRQDLWLEHFRLETDGRIIGSTPIGRTTIAVLNMNEVSSEALRAALINEGVLSMET